MEFVVRGVTTDRRPVLRSEEAVVAGVERGLGAVAQAEDAGEALLLDTVLTSGLHVVSGTTLVWLAASLTPARTRAAAPALA
jgi:hypothetical protein